MIRIKIILAKLLRKMGFLDAALNLIESAQKDLKRKADKLKQEIENAAQEGK